MSAPPSGPGPNPSPSAPVCYRHPDRPTGISCQRCHRPICGECMIPASVGFQCPSCAGQRFTREARRPPRPPAGVDRGRTVDARSMFGRPHVRDMPVTLTIVGLTLLITLLGIAMPTLIATLGYLPVGTELQLWRPITYLLITTLPWGLLNLLFFWLIGVTAERGWGRWAYLSVFVLSGLGGAFALHLFGGFLPWLFPGSTLAVMGLIAASAAFKLREGEDVRPDLILLGVLVVANVVLSFSSGYWIGVIGAVLVGGYAGLVLAYVPAWKRSRRLLLLGLGALACLAGTLI